MAMSDENRAQVSFGPCCFCGQDIKETEIDPCRLTVETSGDKWQVWYCHGACFRDRIVKHPQIDLSPAHF
jgi:hypothetical protein